MGRARTGALALCFIVAAGLFGWEGVSLSAEGLSANLIADLLLAAFLTVAVREAVVRRQRHDTAREIADWLEVAKSAIGPLAEDLQRVRAFAVRRWVEPNDTWDLWLNSSKLLLSQYWDERESTLLHLTAKYGTIDFVRFLRQIWSGQESLQPLIDDVQAGLDALKKDQDLLFQQSDPSPSSASVERANSALHALEMSVEPVLAKAENLMEMLERAYPPREFASQRIAAPFPGWVFAITAVLAVLAGATWLASWVIPHWFPPGFSADIFGNVLAGLAAASIAWAVAVLAAYSRRREVIGLAKFWYNNLMDAISVVMEFTHEEFKGDRQELSREIIAITTESVSQLENVIPDVRLRGYTQQFLRSLEDFAAGRFEITQDVDPRVMAELGLGGMQSPTPRGLRMIEEASRVSHRATEVYIL